MSTTMEYCPECGIKSTAGAKVLRGEKGLIAETMNEMDRLRRVNKESNELLNQVFDYVDEKRMAQLGECRVMKLIEDHKKFYEQRLAREKVCSVERPCTPCFSGQGECRYFVMAREKTKLETKADALLEAITTLESRFDCCHPIIESLEYLEREMRISAEGMS